MDYKNITRPDRLDKTFKKVLYFEHNIESCRMNLEWQELRLVYREKFIGPLKEGEITYEGWKDRIKGSNDEISEFKKIITKLLKDNPEIEPRYMLHKLTT